MGYPWRRFTHGRNGTYDFDIIVLMKIIGGIILTILLTSMTLSLFHVSTEMSTHDFMKNCPFMTYEEVLCPMNSIEHIGMWKSFFLATIPTIILLLVAVVIAGGIIPSFLFKIKYRIEQRYCRYTKERIYTFSYRILQEFFSNGILHPKVF